MFRASGHATPDRDGTLSTPTVSTYETLFPLAVAVKSPPAIELIDGGDTLDVGFAAPNGQVVAVLIPRAVFVELQAVALVWKDCRHTARRVRMDVDLMRSGPDTTKCLSDHSGMCLLAGTKRRAWNRNDHVPSARSGHHPSKSKRGSTGWIICRRESWELFHGSLVPSSDPERSSQHRLTAPSGPSPAAFCMSARGQEFAPACSAVRQKPTLSRQAPNRRSRPSADPRRVHLPAAPFSESNGALSEAVCQVWSGLLGKAGAGGLIVIGCSNGPGSNGLRETQVHRAHTSPSIALRSAGGGRSGD